MQKKKAHPGVNKRATLADVGRMAGVSNVAASAVLNASRTSSRVSAASRKRILEAAKTLNYRPNVAAQALVKNRMNLIGVSVRLNDNKMDHYFQEVFSGILEEANRQNQNTIIFNIQDWAQATSELSHYCDGRIDGMILIAPTIPDDELPKLPHSLPHRTPLVSLHANHSSDLILNIESNETEGAYQMVKKLIEMGHRRIAHFGVDLRLLGGRRRLEGYQKALKQANIRFDPRLHLITEYGVKGGVDTMKEWFRTRSIEEIPEAIFCANDAIAAGCLEVLSEKGIRVPDEISLCGFDDSIAARTSVPQLSTVRQPLQQMGHEAVQALMSILNGQIDRQQKLADQPLVFDTEVIIRKSTAPPASTRNPISGILR